MTPAYIVTLIAFGISTAMIILGFVALLTQKTYLDPVTRQPTSVEVPLMGKLKTNYPALVFVFLGFALAVYAFRESIPPPLADWTLRGSFKPPDDKKIDWSKGTLTFVPSNTTLDVSEQGTFEIKTEIEEGKSLEDVYEILNYTSEEGSVDINLKREHQAYVDGATSLVSEETAHTRIYKPKELSHPY